MILAAVEAARLWTTRWSLGVPARETAADGTTLEIFARFRAHDWIGNSRNTADEDVIRSRDAGIRRCPPRPPELATPRLGDRPPPAGQPRIANR
jgi:hypothetical protein